MTTSVLTGKSHLHCTGHSAVTDQKCLQRLAFNLVTWGRKRTWSVNVLADGLCGQLYWLKQECVCLVQRNNSWNTFCVDSSSSLFCSIFTTNDSDCVVCQYCARALPVQTQCVNTAWTETVKLRAERPNNELKLAVKQSCRLRSYIHSL